MYKQIIIARKDLHMSPGKLAAQVSHASMVFLSRMVIANTVKIWDNRFSSFLDTRFGDENDESYISPKLNELAKIARCKGEKYFYASKSSLTGDYEATKPAYHYETNFSMDSGIYEEWLTGIFTKVVLQARNKNHLLKARIMANELGMIENRDYFLIRDCCNTELSPEDEDGRTLTAIGFRPMEEETIDQIGKKYHIYT